MLYVFWASLWLGLMRLSVEAQMPQRCGCQYGARNRTVLTG